MTHVATEDEGTAETATGGESGTGRLEAFSDAIISIAATLLVLDLKVPDTRDLARSLVHLWPAYLAFAVSFLITGVVWLNHHTMFRFIVRMDRMLMLLNLLLLMSVAFLPFPTEVLAEALSTHQGVRAAAVLYGAALVLGGVVFNAVWIYASAGHRYLGAHISPAEARALRRRFALGPLGYLVGTLVALVAPYAGLLIFAGLLLVYAYEMADEQLRRPYRAAGTAVRATAPATAAAAASTARAEVTPDVGGPGPGAATAGASPATPPEGPAATPAPHGSDTGGPHRTAHERRPHERGTADEEPTAAS